MLRVYANDELVFEERDELTQYRFLDSCGLSWTVACVLGYSREYLEGLDRVGWVLNTLYLWELVPKPEGTWISIGHPNL